MRIAYVTDQFLTGDATDTIQIASMASALGRVAEVTLVLPAKLRGAVETAASVGARFSVEPTFRVLPLKGPYPAPFGFRGLEKVTHAALAALSARALDVVYTRNLPVVLAALGGTRLPVFYETYRPWPDQARDKRVLFAGLEKAGRLRGLVLHSHFAAASYRRIGFADDRLLVAHNGIDRRKFAELTPAREARRRLGLPEDGVLAVYTGHISPDKGLGMLLDAAERLPELRLALVGSAGEGPIERRAKGLANVLVVPWQAPGEVAKWLMAGDLVVIPPTRRPLDEVGNTVLPIKTFQYMASGRAVIGPDAPDVREVLAHDDNAWLTAPDDLGAFVRGLERLMGDAALRERLGARARAIALDNTWEARAARIVEWVTARAV